ncbi:hypothetical protein RFI_22353 [Reticulomyxa filosa]|uniref:Uncharacterized protein n=1 Tax=Reticulomyxa filosa TaxID=46433 RepID=X6MLY0_RETFI|nr:hypothetical protein RFI_22353 [Reticulomyxa filosa]|eukprot:ETO15018.1 hypothetical protein RFI_22353 [Reticulomyxa filosa]
MEALKTKKQEVEQKYDKTLDTGNNMTTSGQKNRKGELPDPLEMNKQFLFNLLQSDRLGWYYHKNHKNWEIVYLVEKWKSDEGKYIVLTPESYYLIVDRNEILHMPPVDTLTVHESIQKLLRALLLKFQETAVCDSFIFYFFFVGGERDSKGAHTYAHNINIYICTYVYINTQKKKKKKFDWFV